MKKCNTASPKVKNPIVTENKASVEEESLRKEFKTL
jgi:hypothetical protein